MKFLGRPIDFVVAAALLMFATPVLAQPVSPGFVTSIAGYCKSELDLEKLKPILIRGDDDAYIEAVGKDKDLKCYDHRLFGFPPVSITVVRVLGEDRTVLPGTCIAYYLVADNSDGEALFTWNAHPCPDRKT